MKVVKVYNNSIVLARIHDRHVIVIGTGCGFGKKPGDAVDPTKVDMRFPFTSDELEKLNLGLLEQLDSRDLIAVKTLVNRAEEKLGYTFRPSMLFSLVDHLRNSETRTYPDDEHPFRWIVKKLHPNEYEGAKWMIEELANGPQKMSIPHSEATAIALHMINNQDASAMPQSIDDTLHVLRVVTLVEYKLNRSLDRNSLGYSRFVTHLRFLLNRIAHPDMVQEPENNRLFQVMYEEASPVAREIVESISLYVEESFGQPIGDAERGYLLLHVHTFVDASK